MPHFFGINLGGVPMIDYAKMNTEAPLDWWEIIASAMLLPTLLVVLTCFYVAWS